jgi:hypothetical protein
VRAQFLWRFPTNPYIERIQRVLDEHCHGVLWDPRDPFMSEQPWSRQQKSGKPPPGQPPQSVLPGCSNVWQPWAAFPRLSYRAIAVTLDQSYCRQSERVWPYELPTPRGYAITSVRFFGGCGESGLQSGWSAHGHQPAGHGTGFGAGATVATTRSGSRSRSPDTSRIWNEKHLVDPPSRPNSIGLCRRTSRMHTCEGCDGKGPSRERRTCSTDGPFVGSPADACMCRALTCVCTTIRQANI